jgi:hypothetical protein
MSVSLPSVVFGCPVVDGGDQAATIVNLETGSVGVSAPLDIKVVEISVGAGIVTIVLA